MIGNLKDTPLSAATIFLFKDIAEKKVSEEYKLILPQIGNLLRLAHYKNESDSINKAKQYINPESIHTELDCFKDYRKVATLYFPTKFIVHNVNERLEKLGIENSLVATICYTFKIPRYECSSNIAKEKGIRVFSSIDMAEHAEKFFNLGLDFLLTEGKAELEYGKISMTENIYDQIINKSTDKQLENIYLVLKQKQP